MNLEENGDRVVVPRTTKKMKIALAVGAVVVCVLFFKFGYNFTVFLLKSQAPATVPTSPAPQP